MSSFEYTCKKCDNECEVEGDFPRYCCWCTECNDEAEGYDAADTIADIMDGIYEQAKNRRKYGNLA